MNLFRIKIPYRLTLTKYVKLVVFCRATRPCTCLLAQNGALRPPNPLYRSFAALFAQVALVKDRVNKASLMFIKVSLSAK